MPQVLLNGNWSQSSVNLLRGPVCPSLIVDSIVEVENPGPQEDKNETLGPLPREESGPTPSRTSFSRRRPALPRELDVNRAKVEALNAASECSKKEIKLIEKKAKYFEEQQDCFKEIFQQNKEINELIKTKIKIQIEIENEKLMREQMLTKQMKK